MKKYLILVWLALWAGPGDARLAGDPLLRNYDPPLMNTQYWAIEQAPSGVLYFASNEGVLAYDGTGWRLSPATNRAPVRSLAIDSAGRLFVGAVGDFGYLKTDVSGIQRFVSLTSELSEADRRFGTVWKTHLGENGVFFQSNEALFRWSESGIRSWRPAQSFHFSFLVRGELWILEREVGLMRLVDESLELVPGGEVFAGDSIYMALPFDEEQTLVATRDRGLYLVGEGRRPERFHTDVDEQLTRAPVYHGVWLDSERLALATSAGVHIVDRAGGHMMTLDEGSGLLANNARYLFLDREDGLWVAMDRGLARVELLAPFSTFGERHGLSGVTIDLARYQGRIYMGTTNGLFMAEPNEGTGELRFQSVGHIRWPVFALEVIQGSLVAATNRGLFEVLNDELREMAAGVFTALLHSPAYPGTLYAGRIDGLSAWRHEAGEWSLLGRITSGDWVINLAQTAAGTLWLGTRVEGVTRIDADADFQLRVAPHRYSIAEGLPKGGVSVFSVDEDIVYSTDYGPYAYDAEQDRFRPDARFGESFADGSRWVGTMRQTPDGGPVWLTWGNLEELAGPDAGYDLYLGVFGGEPADTERWNRAAARLSDRRVFTLVPDGDEALWIALEDTVLRFDLNEPARRSSLPSPILTRATVDGVALRIVAGSEIRAGQEVVVFSVALPSFADESRSVFSYRLEGLNQSWSKWTTNTEPSYANLAAGEYRLRVRARDVYGRESNEIQYEFAVLPPWYQTTIAYLFYVLVALLLLFLGDKQRHRHLESREKTLARLVDERSNALETSEARYRSLVDNARDAIFTTDRDGKIMTINRAGTEITGFEQAELLGRPFKELATDASRAQAEQLLEPGEAKQTTPLEVEIHQRDGRHRTLEVTRHRLFEDGIVSGIEAVARDVTLRKEMEGRLGNSQRLESLGLLAGGVAHDFNNLLTVIVGNAELARKTLADDSTALACLDDIFEAGERASDLTAIMLDYVGGTPRDHEPVDLGVLIRDAVALTRSGVSKMAHIEADVTENAIIKGDSGQLSQVIVNLITNAVEALPPEGGRVGVEIRETSLSRADVDGLYESDLEPGTAYVLSVSDNGVGMNRQTRSRIFDPFFTTKVTGRGLGLSATLGIVRSHRGAVRVKSREHEGTVVEIVLPKAFGAVASGV